MGARSHSYTDSFRADAAALVRRGDRSLRQVAHDLGVNHWTLRDWVRRYDMANRKQKSKKNAPKPPPAREPVDEELKRLKRENARLERQVAQLEMDREILKKAAAFFAKESE